MINRLRAPILRVFGERWFYGLGYYYLLAQPEFRASVARFRSLKGREQGKRAFIIGNGPSLKQMDLSPLKDEVTFGLNRIYLLFPELGFTTSYYLAINKLVIEQCAAEIQAGVPGLKFVSYDARRWMPFSPEIVYLYSRDGPRFYTDLAKGIWQGATVTFTAMQVAHYLGIRQLILIGVDHNYSAQGKPHATVISSGADPDHFDERYFGRGFRWQLPDLELSELAYRLAKEQFEKSGGEIVDATRGGKLDVFRKVDYESLFDTRRMNA
jgi:hypothetical protein